MNLFLIFNFFPECKFIWYLGEMVFHNGLIFFLDTEVSDEKLCGVI